jgi:hypothetical protein
VRAGDTAAVLDAVRRAKERCQLEAQAKVHSCYEAGRDGWWLHRWLSEQGIDNLVVDSASIEVNRRARRAKTDRLAGDKLLVTAYCPRQRAIDSAYGSRDGSRSLGSLSATASANPHGKVLAGTVYSDRHSLAALPGATACAAT